MKKLQSTLILFSSVALVLQACGASPDQSRETIEAAANTAIAQTEQASQLLTAAASTELATPTNTPELAQPSDTATITLTPTPAASSSVPYVWVSVDTNCRAGPHGQHKLLARLIAGQQAEVVAVFPGSEYVVIKNPYAPGNCWLWLRYANTTDFSAYSLPIAARPPDPNPTATPFPGPGTPNATYAALVDQGGVP